MSATPSATPSANTIAGATENNQRLFLRFRKVFAENNPREFAQFAEKLTKWLGDRKAYYEAARPEIIRLLLVAETTVRAALNVPSPELITPFNVYEHPPHPLVPPYVSMVETVCRFEDSFEPAFKEYIKRMRANITPPPGHPLLSTMNQKGLSSSETTQPTKAIAQPVLDPDIQVIDKPQPSYTDRPPPHSAHPEAMSVSTTQPPAPVRTRKVKKKKTLDFDALAEVDIQDALDQQKRAQSGDNSALKAVLPAKSLHAVSNSPIAGPSNRTSMAHKPSPEASGEHAQPIDLTTSEVHKGTPNTPSYLRLSSVSDTVPPPAALGRPMEANMGRGVQQRSEENAAPLGAKSAADITQTTLFTSPEPLVHNAPMEVDSHPQAGGNNGINMQKDATSPLVTPVVNIGPGNQEILRETSVAYALVGRPSSVEGAKSSSHRLPSQPTVSRPVMIQPQQKALTPTSQSGIMSMDIDNQEPSQHRSLHTPERDHMNIDSVEPTNGDTLTSGAKNEQVQVTESPSLRAQQEILALPSSDNVRASSSMSISSRQPSVSLSKGAAEQTDSVSIEDDQGHNPERYLQSLGGAETSNDIRSTIQNSIKAMTPTTDQSTDTFTGCSMRVIAVQKGPSKGSRITINFVIEREKFLGIATWSSRQTGQKPHLRDLENSSICISLGCYTTDGLAAQARKEGCDTIEKQLASLHSTWPTGDQVSIDVMFGGKRAKLPLAPPFQVTPDNFVDISQFANEGANVIQLCHQRDLNRYTYVLLVHHPTQAQLKQVREQWQRDNEWTEWLKDLTKPFSLPLHPAAGVV